MNEAEITGIATAQWATSTESIPVLLEWMRKSMMESTGMKPSVVVGYIEGMLFIRHYEPSPEASKAAAVCHLRSLENVAG